MTLVDSRRILWILQLGDGLFPIGAFAFSDGLETAVQQGHVTNSDNVNDWLLHYIDAVFCASEGPALLQAMVACPDDWTRVEELDREVTAMKSSSETRASSQSLGLRLLKTVRELYPSPDLEALFDRVHSGRCHGNIPIVFGFIFRLLNIEKRDALLTYAYSRLSGTVSAALRLAPVGQQEMQQALVKALEQVPSAVDAILEYPSRHLTSFVPRLDVCQMEHRYLYSRLFRS